MYCFAYPMARRLAAATVLGGMAMAGLPPAGSLAEAADAGISPRDAPVSDDSVQSGKPAPPPGRADTRATLDPIRARIKYLHDRLRITPAQEPLWADVAQAMRDNATALAPLLKERLQSAEKGDAVDNLGAYEKLGEAQLDGLKKFIAAFTALYAGLSADQKKIADAVFRIGPLGMVGGIPESADMLIAPEALPSYPPYAGLPPTPSAPGYPGYPAYPTYPPYAYAAPYAYYPHYGPWLWAPGPSFLYAQGFLHRHGFFPGPFGRPGFVPGRAGVAHRR